MINVLGDSLGAGIVHHLSRSELKPIPTSDLPAVGRQDDINVRSNDDIEKGKMELEVAANKVFDQQFIDGWQSTSM